jgi:hypothetical protein
MLLGVGIPKDLSIDRVLGVRLIERSLGWACGDCLILGVGVVGYMMMSNDGEHCTKHLGCIFLFSGIYFWTKKTVPARIPEDLFSLCFP